MDLRGSDESCRFNKKMELYVHSAIYACELSIAAGSAMSFSKEKWNVGPSLHSAANRPQLNNKILPLTLKTSDIFQLALHVMNDLKVPQKEKMVVVECLISTT